MGGDLLNLAISELHHCQYSAVQQLGKLSTYSVEAIQVLVACNLEDRRSSLSVSLACSRSRTHPLL